MIKPEILRDLAVTALEDSKGIEVLTIDIRPLTTIADYMVICTGRSTRHVKALADSVAAKAKEHKATFVHIEGERDSEWILVDLGDVIVHVMLATTRTFYSLEDLWTIPAEKRSKL
jgi:ribosome-associated protein